MVNSQTGLFKGLIQEVLSTDFFGKEVQKKGKKLCKPIYLQTADIDRSL